MFKKTIKYKDFDGNDVEEDFYFHLSKADLMKLNANGDIEDQLKQIMASKDNKAILQKFEDFIRMSVGIRSEDGRRFIKTADAQSQFLDSPAYDEFLVELLTNANMAAEFIRNLVPKDMADAAKKDLDKLFEKSKDPFEETDKRQHPNPNEDARPAYQKEGRAPTHDEMQAMSRDEFLEAWKYFNE